MKKKLPYPACEYLPFNVLHDMKEEVIESRRDGLEQAIIAGIEPVLEYAHGTISLPHNHDPALPPRQ